MAAPSATTSSGWTPLHGSRRKKSATTSCTRGMRVMPPTRMTSSISSFWISASSSVRAQISIVRSMRSLVSSSSFERDSEVCRCSASLRPVEMMNGRLISVSRTVDSSHFAFSDTSFRRCSAILSLRRSTLCSFWNPNTSQSMTRLSKSSPPRKVSPAVEMTSNTPFPISSSEMSKVPPPRS